MANVHLHNVPDHGDHMLRSEIHDAARTPPPHTATAWYARRWRTAIDRLLRERDEALIRSWTGQRLTLMVSGQFEPGKKDGKSLRLPSTSS